MQAAPRPFVIAGFGLLGAFLVVTPAARPLPDLQVADPDVRLADASSPLDSSSLMGDLTGLESALSGSMNLGGLQNVPINLFDDIVNIPYNEFDAPYTLPANLDYATSSGSVFDGTTYYYPGGGSLEYLPTTTNGALNELTNTLNYDGNLFQITSTNVLGIDPGDPPKEVLANVLLPILGHDASTQFGVNSISTLEASLPLESGCVALDLGGCPNFAEILDNYLKVSPAQLEAGYTFPGATATNAYLDPVPYGVSDPSTSSGTTSPLIPVGTPTNPIPLDSVPGTTLALQPLPYGNVGDPIMTNPSALTADIVANLTQTPTGVHLVDPSTVLPTLTGLTQAMFNSINPFVQQAQCPICLPFIPGGPAELNAEFQLLVSELHGSSSTSTTTTVATDPNLTAVGPESNVHADGGLSGFDTQTLGTQDFFLNGNSADTFEGAVRTATDAFGGTNYNVTVESVTGTGPVTVGEQYNDYNELGFGEVYNSIGTTTPEAYFVTPLGDINVPTSFVEAVGPGFFEPPLESVTTPGASMAAATGTSAATDVATTLNSSTPSELGALLNLSALPTDLSTLTTDLSALPGDISTQLSTDLGTNLATGLF